MGAAPGHRATRRTARRRARPAAPHPLLICDEVGSIPFAPEAAALFYALIANRYERASLIVSSNKPFSAWTEIFGDAVAVAAMVDRLVHHPEIINLKGDSYRLKDRRNEVTSECSNCSDFYRRQPPGLRPSLTRGWE
jgi:DNA replication protein DnaC